MSLNKNLPPSQQKLKKAREDGDVAKSRDFTTACILIGCNLYVFSSWNPHLKIAQNFNSSWRSLAGFQSNNMIVYTVNAGVLLLELLAPVLVLLFACALLAETVQVGFHISFKSLKPDLKRLGFFKGFKRMLGIPEEGQGASSALSLLYEIGKMLFVFLFAIGLWCVFSYSLSAKLALVEPSSQKQLFNLGLQPFSKLVLGVVSFSVIVGLFDFLFQRKKRNERLKMDAEEFKKEMRESEGDPEVKGMRKQLFQETLMGSSLNALRKAKMLVLGRRKVE